MRQIQIGGDFDSLIELWRNVEKSGQYSEGYCVSEFENYVTELMGGYHVAFNSAGTALFSVMRYFDPGIWIVPSNTFFATGAMVQEAGHQVKLADCSRDDFSMSLKTLQEAYTGKEMGVVLTHVGGGIAQDYEAIANFCEGHDLILIEDAAHAFGAHNSSQFYAGDLSTAAVFSFYPTKAVPVGEGGLVSTCNPNLALFLSEFRNYGKSKDSKGVIRYSKGFNFRMSEWDAAVALHQVRRHKDIIEARHQDFLRLSSLLPPLVTHKGVSNHYKYIIHKGLAETEGLIRFTGQVYSRSDQLVTALNIRPDYGLPNSDWVAENHVCLPLGENMYQGMSDFEIMKFLRSVV